MNSFFSLINISLIMGCLLLGGLCAYLLYYSQKNISVSLRRLLAIIRVLAVALIAWLIVAPLISINQYTLEKPIIIIGQDNSLSVKHFQPAQFNAAQYQKDMETLKAKLEKSFEVHTYNFGDSVSSGFDFKEEGKQTNATLFFKQMSDVYLNRNVGAIILASDGIFNRGGNPLYDLKKFNTSIYTIALGDSIAKRDVLISNVNYNNLVNLDDNFTVEIQVQAYQCAGTNSLLTIQQNGVKIQEQKINFKDQFFNKIIPIKLQATKVGVQKFTVSLSAVAQELTTQNNTQTFYVEVIDGRQKILIAAAAPHPDLAVLKGAISQNKHYEVTLALPEELKALVPSKFDVMVLYQMPETSASSDLFMKKVLLAKAVPTWYILGAQTNFSSFNQIQQVVNYTAISNNLQQVYPIWQSSFSNFSLFQKDENEFKKLAPLTMVMGKTTVAANASVLFNQGVDQLESKAPLWFFTNNPSNVRLSYLLGEGLWRWKLAEAQKDSSNAVVDDLITKTVQYLSQKDDKRKFRVFSAKQAYEVNEEIILNATLYNDNYQPVNTAEVTLILKDEQGKSYNFAFSKTENAYLLDVGHLPPGAYTYRANTNLGGKKYAAEGGFYIRELWTEYQQTTANHQLLHTMSEQNNGKMFMPSQLLGIVDELNKSDQVKTISYEDKKFNEFIQLKWLFVVILALLSLEWFLRKRNGEL